MYKIYPNNFESKIGFDKIREILKSHCLSIMGQEMVEAIEFMTSYKKVSFELLEVDEFVALLQDDENFPTSNYFDLRGPLERIHIEGRFMEVGELFELRRSLDTINAIVKYLSSRNERYPTLNQLLGNVKIFPYVKDRIDTILTPTGQIKDNASPELAEIRKNLKIKTSQVSKRLQSILKSAQQDGLVELDASISIRDGRPVIPVASGMKRKLSGIVHDESATGKTSYIEPSEVVELNNEIRELEYAEKREIIRILIAFANDIRPYLSDLEYLYEFLGTVDFIRAKAILARRMNAVRPDLSESCMLDWERAIHPLLRFSFEKEKRTVVPLDIKLTNGNNILLISGPNAGGKSVCLKTVGLLQYMLQSGLLIPVREGSLAGMFENIFIDIGDEQSIENDLSTYSSHLLNMKFFIKNATARTLILIDEFGTGTEPLLGGVIAEAILSQLNNQGVFGVITTHYTNLKHFASSTKGICNGAMLYDTANMEPLFRLEIGEPGSSFAFEIARKIGLPENILQNATDKIGKDYIDFDKHLRSIIRDKRYWESKRNRIKQVEKTLDDVSSRYESNLKKLDDQRKQILAEAKAEAENILASANKVVENTIREIKESQAEKGKTLLVRKKLESFKEELFQVNDDDDWINKKIEKIKNKKERRKNNNPSVIATENKKEPELEQGSYVKMKGQTIVGEVLELDDKKAIVAFGNLRTSVLRDKLTIISGNEARKEMRGLNRTKANVNKGLAEKKLNFKSEIDVRGQRAEEAIMNIRALIDDAAMLNVGEIRILHGKGNGILKEVIRNFLKSEPIVISFRDEHVQFGGSGITIVEMG